LKSIFRMTVRVSCISGSKSPHPVTRNKDISTGNSHGRIRLNPIYFLIVFYINKNLLIQKGNETAKNISEIST